MAILSGQRAEPVGDPPGIRRESVVPWLAAHVPGLRPPVRFTRITGGRSNLTYRVDAADGATYVLRRPPLAGVLSTAHDMRREHDILAALAPGEVPVPPVVALCTDDSVTGSPFYVMTFVPGRVLADGAWHGHPEANVLRARVSRELVDILARIHGVDVDAAGLGGLRRRDPYLSRQLARWHRQYTELSQVRVARIDQLHTELVARQPDEVESTLVHGDFRLDNCLVSDAGNVLAVLDWELATVGDPLADLGLFLAYWRPPAHLTVLPATSAADGFPTRDEVVDAYHRKTGRRVRAIDYYVAFGYWKLACILSGVHARAAAGAMGSAAFDVTSYPAQIELLAEAAAASLNTKW
ncbi:phosphotransferase family protein [Amycolatopsis sp. GM8]|uniref:phosphotransferase family protein n=1 Tax=Amycolatopsis sp. GM8 TaxID=2896530 RepID=UPI001F308DD8|nr:phosphotransferase family protein [Amycolatopsis sp. GM8]